MDDVSSTIKTFILLIYYIINSLLKFRYIYGLCLDEGKQNTYAFLDPQLIHCVTKDQKHKHISPIP